MSTVESLIVESGDYLFGYVSPFANLLVILILSVAVGMGAYMIYSILSHSHPIPPDYASNDNTILSSKSVSYGDAD